MQIKSLTLTNFRAFEQANFEFEPGMNLLVGINGVGKSTVLDAIRTLLSQVLPKFSASKSKLIAFTARDIKFDRGALTAEIKFDAEETAFNYLVHQPHENYIAITDREGEVRGQTYDLVKRQNLQPDVKDIPKHLKTSSKQPLAVYFSTRRSLSSMAALNKQVSAGGQAAAFAEALSERELRLREFAENKKISETKICSIVENGYSQPDKKGRYPHFCFVIEQVAKQILRKTEQNRKRREAIHKQSNASK